MTDDLIIRDGTIIDGTGAPAYRGDVAIRDGRILAVGEVPAAAGANTIDAGGCIVAPGFFDMHTHYDCQLRWDPLATSSCWHGVTTVLTGNCGFGVAPGRRSDAEYLMRMMATVEGIHLDVLERALDWSWESFGEYLDAIGTRLGVNVAAQVPHSALRYYVIGKESYERPSTAGELGRMKSILAQALADGAMGFSSSHLPFDVGYYGEPVPSRLGTLEEIRALAGVMAGVDRGVMTMNPYPGGSVVGPEYQQMFIDAAADSGRPVIWSQLMHRWDMPDQWRASLGYLDRAAAAGAPIYALTRAQSMDNEFNFQGTVLFRPVAGWDEVLNIASPAQKKARLADPATRARLRREWDELPATPGRLCRPDLLEVQRPVLAKNAALAGRRVHELAATAGVHPADWLVDLALEEDLKTQFVFIGAMNGDEHAVASLIQHPRAIIGTSDAGAHLDNDCGVDFIDVFLGHWVRDRGAMPIEAAIARLTAIPAGVLGIRDRGRLLPGMAADVTVFELDRLRPLPREMVTDLPGGFPRLTQKADGFRTVIVNGQVLLRDGTHTGALPGRVLGRAAPGN